MGNFHIIIIIRQCSKEVLPSEQILVLDPGKVVIRSDHLAPCPPGIGGFSVHLHQMGALGIIASYSIYSIYSIYIVIYRICLIRKSANHWIFSFITRSFEQFLTLLSSDKIEDNLKQCQKNKGHKVQYQKEKSIITRESVCAGSQSRTRPCC